MNEQEVDVWAARVERIWNCRVGTREFDGDEFVFLIELAPQIILNCLYAYFEPLQPGFAFRLVNTSYAPKRLVVALYPNGEIEQKILFWPPELPVDFTLAEREQKLAQFAVEWMPLFRRNCWLSGGNIEASNHEKVEWMQGFTPDELEVWKLKL